MKSITLHNINDSMERLITKKAKEKGLSLNKTIKQLLEQSLGMGSQEHGNDFIEFLGLWSRADDKEFQHTTQSFRKVNSQDWQ